MLSILDDFDGIDDLVPNISEATKIDIDLLIDKDFIVKKEEFTEFDRVWDIDQMNEGYKLVLLKSTTSKTSDE